MTGAPFPGIAAIELIVPDLAAAGALLTEVLGCPVVSRGPAGDVAGERLVVDAGGLLIALLTPAVAGDAPVLPDRSPRLSALRLAAGAGTAARVERSIEAGLIVVERPDGSVVLAPEGVAGALGWSVGIELAAPGADDDG